MGLPRLGRFEWFKDMVDFKFEVGPLKVLGITIIPKISIRLGGVVLFFQHWDFGRIDLSNHSNDLATSARASRANNGRCRV